MQFSRTQLFFYFLHYFIPPPWSWSYIFSLLLLGNLFCRHFISSLVLHSNHITHLKRFPRLVLQAQHLLHLLTIHSVSSHRAYSLSFFQCYLQSPIKFTCDLLRLAGYSRLSTNFPSQFA